MNKKKLLGTLAVLSIVASIAMYVIGGNSANLTELKEFWWVPLPLAAICLLGLAMSKKTT